MGTSVTAAIIGLVGVVVGAALAYLQQWRQRRWSVENSKVQHERAIEDEMRQRRYERLKQKLDVISVQIGLKTTYLLHLEAHEMGEYLSVTKEQCAETLRQIETQEGEVQSALMATGSEELRELHNACNSYKSAVYNVVNRVDLRHDGGFRD